MPNKCRGHTCIEHLLCSGCFTSIVPFNPISQLENEARRRRKCRESQEAQSQAVKEGVPDTEAHPTREAQAS